jgi:flavin reductase (DIM6/NTAB) family NADH-FMN oxidoreductase RutF
VPVLDEVPEWFSGRVRDRVDLGDHTGFLLDIDTAEVRRRPPHLLCRSDVADFEPGHEA